MHDQDIKPPSEGSIDLIAMWRLLFANKLLIICCSVLGGAIAATVALTETPMFRAEVVVTEVRDPSMGAASSLSNQFGGIAALAGINLSGGAGEGADARAVLNSRRLSEEFVKRPGLLHELNPRAQQQPSLWMAVKRFRESTLSISEDARKGTTMIAMVSEDPTNAARWANEYIALANEILRARALADANRNIAYLNAQIAQTNAVEIQRVMYNLVENETKVAMLANARKEYAFAIVDPAVPPEIRFSPRRSLMTIVGLILGGFLGVAVVLARNMWRRASSRAI